MTTWRCAAFALPELAATLVIVGVAVAMLLVGAGRARLAHNSAASQNQLRWIAGVTASYAADHQDRLWGLTWTLEGGTSAFPDLQRPDDHLRAAVFQAIDIMRRRGVWADIRPPTGWIPSVQYSHLPLADYLDVGIPMFEFVSPGDTYRLSWARDPEGYAAGAYLPFQPSPVDRKNVYSSSYQPPVAMMTRPWSGQDSIRHADAHDRYITPTAARMAPARLGDVRYPAQKVLLFDKEQRSNGAPLYWAEPRAAPQTLRADGAAGPLATSQTNLGWYPIWPWHLRAYTRFIYDPQPWEAPPDPARTVTQLAGRYRFTRAGPAGRDFGGPEIDIRGP